MLKPNTMQQAGMSLLELLLVLALVATILAISANQFLNYQRSKNIALLEKSVSNLMQAVNLYYFANCHSSTITETTLQTLVEQGYVDSSTLINVWGNFYVKIISSTGSSTSEQPTYVLQVAVDFSKVNDMNLQSALAGEIAAATGADPDSALTGELTWTMVPAMTRDSLNSTMWVSDKPMGSFGMPNFNLASTGQGMSSSLWVLNADGQTFSQIEQLNNSNIPNNLCPN